MSNFPPKPRPLNKAGVYLSQATIQGNTVFMCIACVCVFMCIACVCVLMCIACVCVFMCIACVCVFMCIACVCVFSERAKRASSVTVHAPLKFKIYIFVVQAYLGSP